MLALEANDRNDQHIAVLQRAAETLGIRATDAAS